MYGRQAIVGLFFRYNSENSRTFAHNLLRMKKIITLTILIFSIFCTTWAQKAPKQKEISQEERQQSVLFANGLKDYYAENYKGAENNFRSIISKTSSNASAYYMLGKVMIETRNYVAAEENLQNAIKADKNNVWYVEELASVLDYQGKYEESCKIWKKACSMDDQNVDCWWNYATSCIYLNNFSQALKIYDKIESIMGIIPEITNCKVEIHLHNNDVKGAVGEYEKLIKKDPMEAEYYVKAANICVANNQTDKAMQYIDKATKLDPTNGELQMLIAEYYYAKGDKAAAFEAYRAAFKDVKVPVESKIGILRMYMSKLSQSDPTPEQAELAKILTEVNPEVLEGWASYASIAIRQKDYKTAAEYFEKALDIDFAVYELWQDYFFSLIKLENYEKILSKEETVLELFPTNSMINYTLGVAHANVGNDEKALNFLEKALKYTYDKTEIGHINSTIAEVYSKMGNETKAEEYRQKANRK